MSSVPVCKHHSLCCSTHTIVGISTIARTEHSVAQTKELACTKHVYHKWLLEVSLFFHIHSIDCEICTGLQVTEVAHDIEQQVSKYVVSECLTNSYDMWHGEDYNHSLLLSRWMLFTGTKNVRKLMTKISSGLVRNKGVSCCKTRVNV